MNTTTRHITIRKGRRIWLGRAVARRLGVRPGWAWARRIEGEAVMGGGFHWFAVDIHRDGIYIGGRLVGMTGFGTSPRRRGGH